MESSTVCSEPLEDEADGVVEQASSDLTARGEPENAPTAMAEALALEAVAATKLLVPEAVEEAMAAKGYSV
ncbi:hypothetical protein GUJ93_ZPchr0012g18801 [Zizania palustris]|uniref:Uncharacterized protein n=1 Tax=Zizania palustris TaxID=103762 RepID=A0A8J5WTL4_ZIZPA|nr:hypothetical protein GUJ93_ZPchr0012g18801 [Zizania palustris]